VKGDFHARFLGGGEPVMAPCYPTEGLIVAGPGSESCLWQLGALCHPRAAELGAVRRCSLFEVIKGDIDRWTIFGQYLVFLLSW
jgi:hypothetical protein